MTAVASYQLTLLIGFCFFSNYDLLALPAAPHCLFKALGLYELSVKIIPLEGKICDKEFQYLSLFFSFLSLVAHSRT